MKADQYLARFGRPDSPENQRMVIHPLEGAELRFEITDRREMRRSTFLEILEEKGISRLLPVYSTRNTKHIA